MPSFCFILLHNEEIETEITMSLERSILLVVGIIVLGSVLLGIYVSPNWFWLTGIMGAHLIQASFTGLCPVVVFMKWIGLPAKPGFT